MRAEEKQRGTTRHKKAVAITTTRRAMVGGHHAHGGAGGPRGCAAGGFRGCCEGDGEGGQRRRAEGRVAGQHKVRGLSGLLGRIDNFRGEAEKFEGLLHAA